MKDLSRNRLRTCGRLPARATRRVSAALRDYATATSCSASVLRSCARSRARIGAITRWRWRCGRPGFTKRGSLPRSSDDPKAVERGQIGTVGPRLRQLGGDRRVLLRPFRPDSVRHRKGACVEPEARGIRQALGLRVDGRPCGASQGATRRCFSRFSAVIRREAVDERNFVKKAVNWALRQIGKRNPRLRRAAIAEAKRIHKLPSASARWIAADALRELTRTKAKRG